MIVRQRGDLFVLVRQHEHAVMAGEIAKHFTQAIRPLKETLYAIEQHDVGWVELDQHVVWNEETQKPYSFMDYPLAPKLEAYSNGIVQAEANSLYAGYLCSKHYSYFIEKITDPLAKAFLEREQTRRQRMRKYFSNEEKQYLVDNFRLLRFCDDLSLALCQQEPLGEPHSWYQNGIQYNGNVYQWYWEDDTHLRLTPNPFNDEFILTIPTLIVNKQRQIVKEERLHLKVMR